MGDWRARLRPPGSLRICGRQRQKRRDPRRGSVHLSPYLDAEQAPKARLRQRPKSLSKGHDPLFKRYPANDSRHGILDVNTQYLILSPE